MFQSVRGQLAVNSLARDKWLSTQVENWVWLSTHSPPNNYLGQLILPHCLLNRCLPSYNHGSFLFRPNSKPNPLVSFANQMFMSSPVKILGKHKSRMSIIIFRYLSMKMNRNLHGRRVIEHYGMSEMEKTTLHPACLLFFSYSRIIIKMITGILDNPIINFIIINNRIVIQI